mmetsp:Transcript_21948/g.50674  ORF Transcript_21948/g.50674 Transcript_21948/m.50674 type:complete len:447 (+) Transcript_21948:381-1721(+)
MELRVARRVEGFAARWVPVWARLVSLHSHLVRVRKVPFSHDLRMRWKQGGLFLQDRVGYGADAFGSDRDLLHLPAPHLLLALPRSTPVTTVGLGERRVAHAKIRISPRSRGPVVEGLEPLFVTALFLDIDAHSACLLKVAVVDVVEGLRPPERYRRNLLAVLRERFDGVEPPEELREVLTVGGQRERLRHVLTRVHIREHALVLQVVVCDAASPDLACDDDDAVAEGLQGLVEHSNSRALDFQEWVVFIVGVVGVLPLHRGLQAFLEHHPRHFLLRPGPHALVGLLKRQSIQLLREANLNRFVVPDDDRKRRILEDVNDGLGKHALLRCLLGVVREDQGVAVRRSLVLADILKDSFEGGSVYAPGSFLAGLVRVEESVDFCSDADRQAHLLLVVSLLLLPGRFDLQAFPCTACVRALHDEPGPGFRFLSSKGLALHLLPVEFSLLL